MTVAGKVAAAFLRHGASICMVDEGGVGGGVVDRLRQLRIPVIGVDFGSSADGYANNGVKYANKRAEIWGALRDWLENGSIPNMLTGENVTLTDELTAPTYTLTKKEEIQLESKKEMRSRGVPSPNVADALACTFAYPSYEYIAVPGMSHRSQPLHPTMIRSLTFMRRPEMGFVKDAAKVGTFGLAACWPAIRRSLQPRWSHHSQR
jgi:hypothetical protein